MVLLFVVLSVCIKIFRGLSHLLTSAKGRLILSVASLSWSGHFSIVTTEPSSVL